MYCKLKKIVGSMSWAQIDMTNIIASFVLISIAVISAVVGLSCMVDDITTPVLENAEVDEVTTELPKIKPPKTEATYETQPTMIGTYVEYGDIYLTPNEINELATLVYLEGGAESRYTKECIASVVLNRMYVYGQTLEEVIHAPNQFEPAELIDQYEPTEECIDIVNALLDSRCTVPVQVLYFRAGEYHDWSNDVVPFVKLDNTYFSYDKNIMNQYN